MPIDPNTLVAAANSVIQPVVQHFTNVKNRKFAREMYNRQRTDALSDWEMQNAYNAPREQMARFKAAGLNPHLIYGNTNEGATVRSSSASSGTAQSPDVDFMRMYDLKQKSAQADLTQKQYELMQEEIELKQAQQYATIASTGKTDAETKSILFDLGMKDTLKDITVEGKRKDVEKTVMEINKMHGELIMAWEKQPGAVKKQMEEILHIQKQNAKSDQEKKEVEARIKLLDQEWNINKVQEKLASKDINPKDPYWIRWFQSLSRKIIGLD